MEWDSICKFADCGKEINEVAVTDDGRAVGNLCRACYADRKADNIAKNKKKLEMIAESMRDALSAIEEFLSGERDPMPAIKESLRCASREVMYMHDWDG